MKIRVIGPDPTASQRGNSVAVRHWAAVFRELGHEVEVGAGWSHPGDRRPAGGGSRRLRPPPGDTGALAVLGGRAERGPGFLDSLRAQVRELEPRVDPDREREAWPELFDQITRA